MALKITLSGPMVCSPAQGATMVFLKTPSITTNPSTCLPVGSITRSLTLPVFCPPSRITAARPRISLAFITAHLLST